ncbi:MAG: NAD(P)-binding domain-containing protein, partial [Acidobacteria bacterium]|nr:NAD(P)-binding domain-containing protein [Acidobacteriota bacterium]
MGSDARSLTEGIGIIGCGLVGRHLGGRALRAGARLAVHDSSRDRAARLIEDGALWADSPAEVARRAGTVVFCLPGPDASHAALFGPEGVVREAPAGTVVVETSTVGPTAVQQMAASLAGRAIEVVDAALSRGGGDAAAPLITLYVGCRPRTYPAAHPVLSALADTLLYCG